MSYEFKKYQDENSKERWRRNWMLHIYGKPIKYDYVMTRQVASLIYLQ